MNAVFTKGQVVRGVVTGRFVVVKTEFSHVVGETIVTVKQIGPNGEIARSTMRFVASILVAE